MRKRPSEMTVQDILDYLGGKVVATHEITGAFAQCEAQRELLSKHKALKVLEDLPITAKDQWSPH